MKCTTRREVQKQAYKQKSIIKYNKNENMTLAWLMIRSCNILAYIRVEHVLTCRVGCLLQ